MPDRGRGLLAAVDDGSWSQKHPLQPTSTVDTALGKTDADDKKMKQSAKIERERISLSRLSLAMA